ncbi:WXG100 family type VII secretion target [Microtetraspora fusca]|uniref:WXG100 family type VII secretion target n=1 Tax=Microtetraspora fusca TaxID=1997 RepID=UPI00082C0506|nr:hypothetical protein [Microtetraspora fusca]
MTDPEIRSIDLKKFAIAPTKDVDLATGFWSTLFHSNIDTIKNWVDNTDPNSVRRAGQYYSAAKGLLDGFAADVKSAATKLAEHYKGPEAVEMQKQLRSLHASVRELAGKLGKTGRALQDYADTLVYAQRNVVEKVGEDSRSDHDIDWADVWWGRSRTEKRAVDHLKRVNERIVENYEALPSEVQQALPNPHDIGLPDFTKVQYDPEKLKNLNLPPGAGGPLPGFDGAGKVPNVNGSVPNAGGSVPDVGGLGGPGSVPGDLGLNDPGNEGVTPSVLGPSTGGLGGGDGTGVTPGGLSGGGTGTGPGSGYGTADLAGYSGPGTLTPSATTLSGPSSTGFPGHGGSSGSGTVGGGSAGIVPGLGGVGAGTSGGGAASRGTGLRGTGAAGANGMVAPGAHGRGQGGEEQADRENSTWLMEDDEVWGDGGSSIPPVLG